MSCFSPFFVCLSSSFPVKVTCFSASVKSRGLSDTRSTYSWTVIFSTVVQHFDWINVSSVYGPESLSSSGLGRDSGDLFLPLNVSLVSASVKSRGFSNTWSTYTWTGILSTVVQHFDWVNVSSVDGPLSFFSTRLGEDSVDFFLSSFPPILAFKVAYLSLSAANLSSVGREASRTGRFEATPTLRTTAPLPPWIVTFELIVTVEFFLGNALSSAFFILL